MMDKLIIHCGKHPFFTLHRQEILVFKITKVEIRTRPKIIEERNEMSKSQKFYHCEIPPYLPKDKAWQHREKATWPWQKLEVKATALLLKSLKKQAISK